MSEIPKDERIPVDKATCHLFVKRLKDELDPERWDNVHLNDFFCDADTCTPCIVDMRNNALLRQVEREGYEDVIPWGSVVFGEIDGHPIIYGSSIPLYIGDDRRLRLMKDTCEVYEVDEHNEAGSQHVYFDCPFEKFLKAAKRI